VIPPDGHTWIDLVSHRIPTERLAEWATVPSCGAVVTFAGTARDHSDGRDGVDQLSYEAYEGPARRRLVAVDAEIRRRWPGVERVALVHRLGEVPIGEAAVVVITSSAHRHPAFASAQFGIDALKSTVPIWKRERWSSGESWGLEAQHLVDVDGFTTP